MSITRKIFLLACAVTGLVSTAAAEDGISAGKILIGQTVGVTGTVAAPVKEMNEGVKAYLDKVNKQGGVHGRKIELLTLDDKFDPAVTKTNAEKLIKEHKVFMLFGGRGTPHTKGIMPLLEEHKVPLLAPSTGATLFHEPPSRLIFNVRAPYSLEVIRAIEHFAFSGITKIGLLHVDDAFGTDALEAFKQGMAQRKLEPANISKFARVKPDNAAAAKEVIAANPSALIIASSSKNTIDVVTEIRKQGGRMQIMTLSNNSSDAFIKDLGEYGAGVILAQITVVPNLSTTKLAQEFAIAAKETGATVSYPAIEGYANAKVLVEGLRRAGPNPTREGLIRALESLKDFDLGGIAVSYGPDDRTGAEFVELTMIGKNGRLIR